MMASAKGQDLPCAQYNMVEPMLRQSAIRKVCLETLPTYLPKDSQRVRKNGPSNSAHSSRKAKKPKTSKGDGKSLAQVRRQGLKPNSQQTHTGPQVRKVLAQSWNLVGSPAQTNCNECRAKNDECYIEWNLNLGSRIQSLVTSHQSCLQSSHQSSHSSLVQFSHSSTLVQSLVQSSDQSSQESQSQEPSLCLCHM